MSYERKNIIFYEKKVENLRKIIFLYFSTTLLFPILRVKFPVAEIFSTALPFPILKISRNSSNIGILKKFFQLLQPL